MKSLPHWGNLLPLLGTTLAYYLGLGWLRAKRAGANRGEPTAPRAKLTIFPAEGEWCPLHDTWVDGECPACRAEWHERALLIEAEYGGDSWGLDDTIGLGPEPDHLAPSDGWYLDLVQRAEDGWDGSDSFRPEGGF